MFSSKVDTTVRPLRFLKSNRQKTLFQKDFKTKFSISQINHVIAWSPKPQFNKKLFKMKVSHAMPKLRPVDAKRLPSSLSDKGGYVHGISRFLSNATTTTEVFYGKRFAFCVDPLFS